MARLVVTDGRLYKRSKLPITTLAGDVVFFKSLRRIVCKSEIKSRSMTFSSALSI